MRQVLFEIPLPFGDAKIPLFGFGLLLIVAFVISAWLAGRRAKAEGYQPTIPWDVGLYVFIAGVIGARLMSLLVDQRPANFWDGVLQFGKFWEGGLVLYGSIPGGLVGYWLAYRAIVKPQKLRSLQIADWLAPSIALGIAFGRLGCFLNGCCYGDVAEPQTTAAALAVQFPANSNPHHEVVWNRGWQTTYGFLLGSEKHDERIVKALDAGSTAKQAGLQVGDEIVKIDDIPINDRSELFKTLLAVKPYRTLTMTVERAGGQVQLAFRPPDSLPLLPTQLFMALDGFLLCGLLWTFYPFRRREGAVMALLMMTYAINRYLIEQLRLDNPEYAGPLTVSQAISIGVFLAGAVLMLWVQLRGRPVVSA